MINLRYHIVSITAVFLALGIGITLGSTFIGRETLDQIRANVDNAREERNQTRAENNELRRELELQEQRAAGLTAEGVQRMFEGDLESVPVLLIAAPGIDQTSLDALTVALNDSAATFLGTLTVNEKVALDEGAVDDMAEVLDATLRDPQQLRGLVTQRLARDMRAASRQADGGGEEPPQSTVPEATESLVGSLVNADFLSFEADDSEADANALLTGHGYRYVVVTGPSPDVADSAFLFPLVQQLAVDRPAPTVVAAAATGEDAEQVRERTLQPYMDDDVIREGVSTVDSLDDFSGIGAVVLSLVDLGVERRGHYGYGEGRTQLPTDPG